MNISREMIIRGIAEKMGSEDYILAIWLEGSDGTKNLDAYSDIDLVCYSKEGSIEQAIKRLDDCLQELGELDLAYEQPDRPANNRYKVYHLKETPKSLLLDVTFQSESFPVSIYKEDKSVVPAVLLDKTGIVRYQSLDPETHFSQLQTQLANAKGIYGQRIRAIKYTQRGLFLEAMIYYQKYVLNPLVDVLRIIHTPFQSDYFLVHASRDFPEEVVEILEDLYGVKNVQEIAERIRMADDLFQQAAAEAEGILSKMK